jgi:hypothetical protein
MNFDTKSKYEAIEKLQSIYRNGQILEMKLRLAGNTEKADEVWRTNRLLNCEIDTAIDKAIDDWLGEAANVISRMEKAKSQLQRSIDEIGEAIKTAKQAVELVGIFDKVVNTVLKIAKGLYKL